VDVGSRGCVDVLEFVTFGFGVVVAFLRRPVLGYTCHGLSGRGGASPLGYPTKLADVV